jgi:hypothetical protein
LTSYIGWLLDVSIENDHAIFSLKTEDREILKLRGTYYPAFYILPRNESLFQSLSREEVRRLAVLTRAKFLDISKMFIFI